MKIDQCDGKEPFASKALADKVAARKRKSPGGRKPYKCPHCRQWHLTGMGRKSMRRMAYDYLKRQDEDWTFSDPQDIRSMSEYVLASLD